MKAPARIYVVEENVGDGWLVLVSPILTRNGARKAMRWLRKESCGNRYRISIYERVRTSR
jgi:hypothetical protein